MRRFTILYGLTISLLLVTAPAVDAAPVEFFAILSGAAEIPANSSPGTGSAHVIFDPDANTLIVEAMFSGLLGNVTDAHIHCCAAQPANVGIATMLPRFTGFPTGVTSGTYPPTTFDTSLAATYNPAFITTFGGGTVAGAEAALFAGMLAGQSYFNIHTNVFPGGEIRGILTTPEAGTLLLLGAGLAGLAQRLWRKPAAS
jgi:CHRD domain-containing protein/PEP-CTERM motif-containing protein